MLKKSCPAISVQWSNRPTVSRQDVSAPISRRLSETCEKEGIPYLSIETDYSPEDVGQLQKRIEAFLEQIRG